MSTRRSWAILLAALCVVSVLGVLGTNVESSLHPSSLAIPGTESARTSDLLQKYFGKEETFVIVLKGPRRAMQQQGTNLVRLLRKTSTATVLSPWERRPVSGLSPNRNAAVIVASFPVELDEAMTRTVPYLDKLLRRVEPPVRAVETGHATIARAIQEEAAGATQRGELIAFPLLLIVLLAVFRSPIAAALPLLFGAATVASARGILAIVASFVPVDAFALTASAMIGLALGVDYTLLLVSRFREELATGLDPVAAASATRRTAGRTVAFAGGTLFVAMFVAAWIVPGSLLVSLAAAVLVVAGVSVALGLFVLPAGLRLAGDRINRWPIGRRRRAPGAWVAPALLLLRKYRPGGLLAATLIPLLLLAAPAASLSLGPPSSSQLPERSAARLDAELVERNVGPGWVAPYVVLASPRRGPITDPQTLKVLKEWEARIADRQDVQAVIGPGSLVHRLRPLRQAGKSFLVQGRPGSEAAKLESLGVRLGKASAGARDLREGVGKATYGASRIANGSHRLEAGAGTLAAGIADAEPKVDRASRGIERLTSGSARIWHGQHQAAVGALALKYDVSDLIPRLRHSTLSPALQLRDELSEFSGELSQVGARSRQAAALLARALKALQEVEASSNEPALASAIEALEAATQNLGGESGGTDGFNELERRIAASIPRSKLIVAGAHGRLDDLHEALPLAKRLLASLVRLEGGSKRLAEGVDHLSRATGALSRFLPEVSDGATELTEGARRIQEGGSSLSEELADGFHRSWALAPGLAKAATRASSGGEAVERKSEQLRTLSPGLVRSGYLNLAAIEGAHQDLRQKAEQAVNVGNGGQAARVLVIPERAESQSLDAKLRDETSVLARAIQGRSGVAGGLAEVADYSAASAETLPLVILAISAVAFCGLVLVLRSVIVPAVAVMLNLLSVGVAFGVLALLTIAPASAPLGGWGYVDNIGAIAIFAVAFGVSIDYSVFILARMREEFDNSGDHPAAVRAAVQQTGGVIVGAALMMVAVFAAFAVSNLAIVSELGIGLCTAILVDAFVIRPLLLPAVLMLIGPRCWWLPPIVARAVGGTRVA